MKIAIQGHLTRGKEVIQILESLGGKNASKLSGCSKTFYHIDKGEIRNDHYPPVNYKFYTLEEFEKEFPFKIGDKVITNDCFIGTITDFRPQDISSYYVKTDKFCIWCTADSLRFNKKMKTRNITLTLNKAKEWYNKGGELKEIALQVFTKEELNSLPKSWEEYCKMYSVSVAKHISIAGYSRKYIALWKLEQLRDCYRQGWKPTPVDYKREIYSIKTVLMERSVYFYTSKEFLSFQSKEVAEEFLKNFEPLIKEAEDLLS